MFDIIFGQSKAKELPILNELMKKVDVDGFQPI